MSTIWLLQVTVNNPAEVSDTKVVVSKRLSVADFQFLCKTDSHTSASCDQALF